METQNIISKFTQGSEMVHKLICGIFVREVHESEALTFLDNIYCDDKFLQKHS